MCIIKILVHHIGFVDRRENEDNLLNMRLHNCYHNFIVTTIQQKELYKCMDAHT